MKNNSKALARGGIYTALSVILIYCASYSPTAKLSFLVAASFIIPLALITIDLKYSILVYAASSVLALIIAGVKAAPASYVLFFGLYGYIKLYAEKTKNKISEYIIKYVFFNAALLICYMLYKMVFKFPMPYNSKYPLIILLIFSQIVFIIFDYIITCFISYVSDKFIKKL